MAKRTFAVFALVLASTGAAWAQGEERTFGEADLGRAPSLPAPQTAPKKPSLIFLSGKVVMPDGTPPGEPVVIERVCNGRSRPETHTDQKGHFSFQFGGNSTVLIRDASVTGNELGGNPFGRFGTGQGDDSTGQQTRGQVDLSACVLKASLAGYRSESIRLGRRSVFDNSDVGTIALRRMGTGVGVSVSATSLAAPKRAKKSYEKAVKMLSKKKPNAQMAIRALQKAVEEYPSYAASWALLGDARLKLEDTKGAREAYQNAIEADSKYSRPYVPLLRLHFKGKRWDQVSKLSEAVLRLNPGLSEAQFYHAIVSLNAERIEEAERSALAVQSGADAQDYPQTHHVLGVVYAKKGDFPKAATEFRSYLAAGPKPAISAGLKRKLFEWEELGVIPKLTVVTATAK